MHVVAHHESPAAIAQPLQALDGLASLLACVDPARWNSVGRPPVAGLAALTRLIHSELESAIADCASPPGP